MKAKSIIIAAVAIMAIVPTASSQEQIKKAFQEVADELAGVTKVGEHNTAKVDANGIAIESKVITIKVERRYQHSVSETLKDAFRNEASKTSMFEEETGGEKLELDSALVHDLGLRRMWSIWRDDDDAVLIGSMKNSTYYIANFNDKKHKGYRTCYAAEWSNADDPEVYTAKLVYVYGQQPKTSQGIATVDPLTIHGTAIPNLPDNLRNRLQELQGRIRVDTIPSELWERADVLDEDIFKHQLMDVFGHQKEDIPFNGNTETWMSLAMQRGVNHLSNTDWHRFFGLLTQKLLDKSNVISEKLNEERIVTAGMLLDLCKHADQLDDDEREVCAKRLQYVASQLSDRSQYVGDLLKLSAKKLEKK